MPGHKTSHTQLERFRLIDSLLSSGETISFDDILEKLRSILRDPALSESTLRRDFRYMKNELAAPLEYDAKKYGWHYTKTYKLPSSGFTDDEILALHLVKKLIGQHSSEDFIFKSIQTLLEKISPSLNLDEEKKAEPVREGELDFEEADSKALTIYDRIFVPTRPKPVLEKEACEKVLFAIKNNFMLDFYYNSKWEPEERHRRIMPFQLVLDEGSLYLYGARRTEPDNPRLFNLSKMHGVEVITSRSFDLPPNFRFHEETEQGRFGAFQYDDYFDFKIEFYGDARKIVREYVWSDNQILEEDSEHDKSILTFTTSQWLPVQKWLLSFGGEAKPLEPDWFVAEWKEIVRKMAKNAE
ncbi:helix-turn-helix transcriptional regulator [Treponema ruminis]|uniref:Putative DNA-binding transcriptional regulator YafY n=1 Tax=Treponema ruminis TaxID=744515 RepID=A0A7W8G6Q6_9SPIR|nr:WYL domain-containing protein [Treponema ruminis]MBB5224845.1 putative DNA-binding transcriptional regulator YafY [Treponema ruminis]